MIFIIAIIGLSIVQVQMFKQLPSTLRYIMTKFPVIALVANFGFSAMIEIFTGGAYGIGLANIVGSIYLGFYIYNYAKKLKLKIEYTLGIIPRFIVTGYDPILQEEEGEKVQATKKKTDPKLQKLFDDMI